MFLLIASGSMSEWRATGLESAPSDVRRNGIGSCIAIIGPRPDAQIAAPPFSDPCMGTRGGPQIVMRSDHVTVQSGSSPDYVALAGKVDAFIDKFEQLFSSWSPVPNDGGAALKAQFAALFSSPTPSVAAIRLRSE